MQHGPLLHFHLYLNHGIALCKYSTREEANKAQMALNNCVLGNTTICAESPSDGEVQSILQHLGVPGASQSQSGASSGSGGSVGGGVSGGQSAWRQPTQATPSRSVGKWRALIFSFYFALDSRTVCDTVQRAILFSSSIFNTNSM